MVRTKKQVIDSIAIKNIIKDNFQDVVPTATTVSDFYSTNIPASPLPTLKLYDTNYSHPHWLPPPTPVLESETLHFEPPYVMNNFWPPLPSDSKKLSINSGKKLESMFSNLSRQEIQEMMLDCNSNEDEAILRLITRTDYLEDIRHRIRIDSKIIPSISKPLAAQPILKELQKISPLLAQQKTAPKPILLPSPPIVQKPTVNKPLLSLPVNEPRQTKPVQLVSPIKEEVFQKIPAAAPDTDKTTAYLHKTHKKHHRSSSGGGMHSTGRLTLDDALQQIKDSKSNEEMDGYAGWSAARLRAFKMIEKNPNSYYYRFNAPGEQQKKGKWTDEENALFLSRLNQVGANSQWGIFSIAIPGRVGYQCSNYYRFMIESGQLHDPNYVLDEKGKARYLFDKKTEDGAVEKIFRKHSKHGSMSLEEAVSVAAPSKKRKPTKSNNRKCDSDDDDDPTFKIKKSLSGPSKKKCLPPKDIKSKKKYPLILPAGVRLTRQMAQYQEHSSDEN
ncbi:hypothetical protein MFLAVUS_000341 [Mucor flavus]|uniref:Myb-like domain-containing protein n=1 Tax=Mucor flavus TaxID=439312 RepID=A0ABP9YJG6_9FUNG